MENVEPVSDVPEGMKLSLLEEEGTWYKVSAPGGLTGWVKAEVLGVI